MIGGVTEPPHKRAVVRMRSGDFPKGKIFARYYLVLDNGTRCYLTSNPVTGVVELAKTPDDSDGFVSMESMSEYQLGFQDYLVKANRAVMDAYPGHILAEAAFEICRGK